MMSQIFDLLTRVQNNTSGEAQTTYINQILSESDPIVLSSPVLEPLIMPIEVSLSPKILSPNSFTSKEVLIPQPSQVLRKIPGRRNISQTSLDFLEIEKKDFEIGFDTPIGTPALDFVPDAIGSSLMNVDLEELPLIGLVGEKRLKNCEIEPLFKEFSEEDKLDILNL